MEELLVYQVELFESLKNAAKNYKNTPKDIIKIPYLETRLEILDELWTHFKEEHKGIILSITSDEQRKHSYFKERTYEVFQELYVQYKSDLKEAVQPFLDAARQVVSKLDPESLKLWEQQVSVSKSDLPTWQDLRNFLESRFRSLEMRQKCRIRNRRYSANEGIHMDGEQFIKQELKEEIENPEHLPDNKSPCSDINETTSNVQHTKRKTSDNPSDLKGHERVNTDENPLTCNICVLCIQTYLFRKVSIMGKVNRSGTQEVIFKVFQRCFAEYEAGRVL
ncbi:unnamed protein product [Leptidea sinapis]|uniref:Uncharacterized protein n=1 Tax=Leptidea sinapis TaxID=189913 RepID=A0A5E4Q922_9NEOP|nr:unnamed protein product [Leptidea sinapis]